MTSQLHELLARLRAMAAEWKAAQPTRVTRDDLVERFRETLDQLYATGWDFALGWENELPDEVLPERYLRRRAEILDALENELGYHAMAYRGSEEGSKSEADAIAQYERTMEELFRIGHWSGAPDAESFLPRKLMPQVYKEYWKRKRES
jgi:hypothetical protein